VYQGTKEADTLGQTVLVNQFVAGLLPEIKSKIVVCEGDFNRLLSKAIFEEAKWVLLNWHQCLHNPH